MNTNIYMLVAVAAAVCSLSFTLTITKIGGIFRGLVGWILSKPAQMIQDSKYGKDLYVNNAIRSGLRCPYCMSHWISGWFAFQFHIQILDESGFMNWFVATFALVGLSALMIAAILHMDHA